MSHAYSYGHLTYYCAYLKTHYPIEFYAAIISTESDTDQQAIYMDDARKRGIQILPPSVNESSAGFATTDDGNIYYGFSGIKGIGASAYDGLISLRPFKSVGDFFIRTYVSIPRINKKIYDSLIKCGALDSFGYKRSVLLSSYDKYLTDFDESGFKKKYNSKVKEEQDEAHKRVDEFIEKESEYFNNDSLSEFNLLEILDIEKELLGIYITGNPFDIVVKNIELKHYMASDVSKTVEAMGHFTGHIVVHVDSNRTIKTKTGNNMAFLDCSDYNGERISLTVFSGTYDANPVIYRAGNYLLCLIKAKPSYKGDGTIDCVIQTGRDLSSEMREMSIEISKKNNVKHATIRFNYIPTSVRLKTIVNKIEGMCEGFNPANAKSDIFLEFLIKSDDSIPDSSCPVMRVGPYYKGEISIDDIRSFNSLSGAIVSTR